MRLVSSATPFELVHCDVSVSRHRYYIVFIDDFSRMSWVYLLKDRGHVYDVLRTFLTEIKNQFAITPKILRTDNALEFV